MKKIDFLTETLTTWKLVRLLLLEFLLCLVVFGGTGLFLGCPKFGLALGIGMGIFSVVMLIFARYFHQKELKKD